LGFAGAEKRSVAFGVFPGGEAAKRVNTVSAGFDDLITLPVAGPLLTELKRSERSGENVKDYGKYEEYLVFLLKHCRKTFTEPVFGLLFHISKLTSENCRLLTK